MISKEERERREKIEAIKRNLTEEDGVPGIDNLDEMYKKYVLERKPVITPMKFLIRYDEEFYPGWKGAVADGEFAGIPYIFHYTGRDKEIKPFLVMGEFYDYLEDAVAAWENYGKIMGEIK